jgi:hypothetical protein
MSTTPLARFLRSLNLDAGLLAAFEQDPEVILADSGLSEADCALLRSPDRYRLLQAAQADLSAAPNF